MERNTPKLFAIQFGSLITLYVSLTSLLVILFNIINTQFPDALTYYSTLDTAHSLIRTAIATLMVFFPAYVLLTRTSNHFRRSDTNGQYTAVMRWFIYLSLLIAGLVLLGDLVTLILYFLNGEITTRFLLKVVVLFLVVGSIFYYYLLDVRGHFMSHVSASNYAAIAAMAVVALSILYGLTQIETPQAVRDMRLDDQMVADLQNIKYSVDNYYATKGALPATLDELFPSGTAPEPPVRNNASSTAYKYVVIDASHYQLCTTFFTDSYQAAAKRPVAVSPEGYSWDHPVGYYCYEEVANSKNTPILQ